MDNLIEKVFPPALTKKLGNKKVLMYGAGGIIVLIGGYALFRGRQESVSYGAAAADYAQEPSSEDPSEASSVTESEILKRLEELNRNQADYEDAFRTMGGMLSELYSLQSSAYTQQYQQYEPYPEVQAVEPTLLQKQVDLLMGTPSFTYTPRDYTEGQVGVMAGWAADEMDALGRGYAGTTKNPVGAGANDLIMEMHPTGHVSFRPRGSEATPTPSSPVTGTAGDVARAAGKENSSLFNKMLSMSTRKSGDAEKQLSGMSNADRQQHIRNAEVYRKISTGELKL